ncbi:MAG: hypothetical protein ACYDAQ_02050 [Mycobacteriales bacterium]
MTRFALRGRISGPRALAPRRPAGPVEVGVRALALLVSGLLLLPPAGPPTLASEAGLTPLTGLARAVAALPAGARAIRVDGLHATLRGGAWTVLGVLSWRVGGGAPVATAFYLPVAPGSGLVPNPLAGAALVADRRGAAPLAALVRTLDALPLPGALAFFDYGPTAPTTPLVFCGGGGVGRARCEEGVPGSGRLQACGGELSLTGDAPGLDVVASSLSERGLTGCPIGPQVS